MIEKCCATCAHLGKGKTTYGGKMIAGSVWSGWSEVQDLFHCAHPGVPDLHVIDTRTAYPEQSGRGCLLYKLRTNEVPQ